MRIIWPLLLTLAVACSSSDKEKDVENLDVTSAPQQAELATGNDTNQDIKPASIPPSAVTNWNNFFQPSPTPGQKHKLAQSLAAWTEKDSTESLLKKGRAELAIGRFKAAEISFRRALRLDNENFEAALELAGVYVKRKDFGQAFEFLATVKDAITARDDITESFITRYRYTLALGYIGRKDYTKGHEILSDLVGKQKNFSPAYSALASSYLELGRLNLAEFIILQGLDRTDKHASLYNLMGVVMRKKKQNAAAAKWFNQALDLQPTYSPALINRAELSFHEMEYETAMVDLRAALAIDPTLADALVISGIIHMRRGQFVEARASFEKAIDSAPSNAEARFNLAILEAKKFRNKNEAIRLFSEVIQLTPKSNRLNKNASNLLNQLQNHHERL